MYLHFIQRGVNVLAPTTLSYGSVQTLYDTVYCPLRFDPPFSLPCRRKAPPVLTFGWTCLVKIIFPSP